MKRLVWLMIGLFLTLPGMAQRNKLQLLRISEDNDALNARREVTDREYTNGTRIDVFYTKTAKARFLSALLIPIGENPHEVNNLYSIGLTQLMYTPSDITNKEVIRTSRPYAALLYITHSLTSSDPIHHQRLTTELDLGVLGKAAFGEEVQTWFHKQMGYNKPEGWSHQLPSDVVINYLIQYEKLLVQPSPNLQILGLLSTNVGTLNNNINAGITFRAGIFSDYFSNYERPAIVEGVHHAPNYRKVQFFFYMRPVARLVMDDSILQGGFFSHDRAQYVVDRDLLKRAFVQFEYGAVLSRNRLGVSFSEKLITPQYEGAPSQQVGNLTLFIGL
ncbi:DUF2219 family protein [Spirosoma sp. HMF3257]|uniref:Lipid A deacylase LpxR family protein n=1 Tax=Spirosoma telluris TaxID=2183553 RepID=A0A327NP66_9BACT|nr:DUF2219 family protein [Spirosoma telluris]RAI74468.1 hypothetical protein HMF3257_09635 [Spirosoma telluris]